MFALVIVTWWSHGISQAILPWKYDTLEACQQAASIYIRNNQSISGAGICIPAGRFN